MHHPVATLDRFALTDSILTLPHDCFVGVFFVVVRLFFYKRAFLSLAHFTYSADFQKCTGWDRRRLRFGSFSSSSTSLEKLGRSSCSYAQQNSRMSYTGKKESVHILWCDVKASQACQSPSLPIKIDWIATFMLHKSTIKVLCVTRTLYSDSFVCGKLQIFRLSHKFCLSAIVWTPGPVRYNMEILTDISLPMPIWVRLGFIPLPTCQIMTSAGWFLKGHSRAWSSYQIVLKHMTHSSVSVHVQVSLHLLGPDV